MLMASLLMLPPEPFRALTYRPANTGLCVQPHRVVPVAAGRLLPGHGRLRTEHALRNSQLSRLCENTPGHEYAREPNTIVSDSVAGFLPHLSPWLPTPHLATAAISIPLQKTSIPFSIEDAL